MPVSTPVKSVWCLRALGDTAYHYMRPTTCSPDPYSCLVLSQLSAALRPSCALSKSRFLRDLLRVQEETVVQVYCKSATFCFHTIQKLFSYDMGATSYVVFSFIRLVHHRMIELFILLDRYTGPSNQSFPCGSLRCSLFLEDPPDDHGIAIARNLP